MALVLKYTVSSSEDCQNLILTDVTGDYSVSNVTGYGAPNPERGDIVFAQVDITLPDETVVSDISLTLPDANLPSTDPTITIITAEDLGFGAGLDEGIYTVNIQESDFIGGVPRFTLEFSFLNTCSTQGCLDKALSDFNIDECTCSDDKLDRLVKMDYYLKAARYAVECNKLEKAKKLLSAAQFLCNQKNCNC